MFTVGELVGEPGARSVSRQTLQIELGHFLPFAARSREKPHDSGMGSARMAYSEITS